MKLLNFFFKPLHVVFHVAFCAADVVVASQVLRLSKVVLIDPFGNYTITGTEHPN